MSEFPLPSPDGVISSVNRVVVKATNLDLVCVDEAFLIEERDKAIHVGFPVPERCISDETCLVLLNESLMPLMHEVNNLLLALLSAAYC